MKNFLLTTALTLTTCCAAQAQHVSVNPKKIQKMAATEFYISQFYVDSVDEDKVIDDAIQGMVKNLDPHSVYIKAKDVAQTTERLNGGFDGVGVQFNIVEDTLVVVQPVSGGPSEQKGILAGDRFITVDDTVIAGVKMSREEIMRRLRGPKGTKVKIGVKRDGVKGTTDFVIKRDKIPVNTLDAHYMVDGTTGYVRIGSFGATTYREFMEAVDELKKQGMRDLVLDLQGNGGGYLAAAVEISNEFLPANELIVYTEGRSIRRQDFTSNGKGTLTEGRVVVLVDSYTASAAEIVSGAVQDNDRGIVVGRRTFGKGLVQRQFELPDGSMLRLTTSHYYSPSGRCIQKPYVKGQAAEYEDDISQRLKNGELTSDVTAPLTAGSTRADSLLRRELFPDSLRFSTRRLKRAVYAGGGIMPDVYVPLDTTLTTPLYRLLSVRGCIINTTLKYVNRNRKALLKQFPNFRSFAEGFTPGDELFQLLREEAEHMQVDSKPEEWTESRTQLAGQLKALLARDLWDMDEYFELTNQSNTIYTEGLRALRDDSRFRDIH
jgi:carboxyl-terminal processing protease